MPFHIRNIECRWHGEMTPVTMQGFGETIGYIEAMGWLREFGYYAVFAGDITYATHRVWLHQPMIINIDAYNPTNGMLYADPAQKETILRLAI